MKKVNDLHKNKASQDRHLAAEAAIMKLLCDIKEHYEDDSRDFMKRDLRISGIETVGELQELVFKPIMAVLEAGHFGDQYKTAIRMKIEGMNEWMEIAGRLSFVICLIMLMIYCKGSPEEIVTWLGLTICTGAIYMTIGSLKINLIKLLKQREGLSDYY